MKLYNVMLKGFKTNYVVADNPNNAIEKVQNFYEKEKLGFSSDRIFLSIEVIADEGKYTEYERLFL